MLLIIFLLIFFLQKLDSVFSGSPLQALHVGFELPSAMLRASFPHDGPHRVGVVMGGFHHGIVPVQNHLCPLGAQLGVRLSQIVLFMGILHDIEEHFLRQKMASSVNGADVDIIIEPCASLADMGALGQNYIGSGAVLSLPQLGCE